MDTELVNFKEIVTNLNLIIVRSDFLDCSGWFEYMHYTGDHTENIELIVNKDLNFILRYEIIDISYSNSYSEIGFTNEDLINFLCYIRDYSINVKTDTFAFINEPEDMEASIRLIKKLILKYGYIHD